MTEDTNVNLRIEAKLDQLIHLVRTGGKESRVIEHVPAWRDADADGECEFTGAPTPKGKLVKHASIKVHPGVVAFAEERGIDDLTKCPDTEVPADYLAVPYQIEFREVYRPPTQVVWSKEQIPFFTRPAMMYLCGQLHVQQTLEERGVDPKLADFRRQTNGWLAECLEALADGKPVPDPLPIGTVKPGRKSKKAPTEAPTTVSEVSEPKNSDKGKDVTPPSPTKSKASAKSKSKPRKPSTSKKAEKSGGSKSSAKPKATSKSSESKADKSGAKKATKKATKKAAKKKATRKVAKKKAAKKKAPPRSEPVRRSVSKKKKAGKKKAGKKKTGKKRSKK